MEWVAIWTWIGVVVFAAVVLGFCVYEMHWKRRRLQSDLDRISALSDTIAALQSELAATQVRVRNAGN